jgi:hypothetical protein
MTLTQNQVHEILSIIEKQTAFYIGSTLGEEYLSKEQKSILKEAGIKTNSLYKTSNDTVLLNFHLGMLSEVLGNKAIQQMTYDQLKDYIVSGQHIPLNAEEKAQIESIKRQSLADITSRKGKVFQDVNNAVANESNRVRAQHEFIRQTVIEGLKKRESVKKISMDLAKLTGDWTRDFEKSVNYISHTAMNEGRLAMIQKRYENRGEAKVYFIVQDTACEHCVKAYLTNGKGSEPREFTIQELLQNGNNIGRKTHEYLPSIQPLHPNCRCLLAEIHPNTEWNKERKTFIGVALEQIKPTVKRSKVRIQFNGKEYMV